MKYGDIAIAAERIPRTCVAAVGDDGKLYLSSLYDGRQQVGTAWDDIEVGDTVRLDPPPGVLRKVKLEVTSTEESHG